MSLKSDKLFVYGRTYVPTDGRTFPSLMLLGQLGGSRPNKYQTTVSQFLVLCN